ARNRIWRGGARTAPSHDRTRGLSVRPRRHCGGCMVATACCHAWKPCAARHRARLSRDAAHTRTFAASSDQLRRAQVRNRPHARWDTDHRWRGAGGTPCAGQLHAHSPDGGSRAPHPSRTRPRYRLGMAGLSSVDAGFAAGDRAFSAPPVGAVRIRPRPRRIDRRCIDRPCDRRPRRRAATFHRSPTVSPRPFPFLIQRVPTIVLSPTDAAPVKITAAIIYVVRIDGRHPIIVELETDAGITGLGEAAIAYGIGETAAAGMIKDLADAIVLGQDPFRIESVWSDMYDHSFWAKRGGPIVFAGISAIEQALWDIKGKALGVPVYELLGGKCRDRVRVYANGWSFRASTPDEFARAAERVLRDGYSA